MYTLQGGTTYLKTLVAMLQAELFHKMLVQKAMEK